VLLQQNYTNQAKKEDTSMEKDVSLSSGPNPQDLLLSSAQSPDVQQIGKTAEKMASLSTDDKLTQAEAIILQAWAETEIADPTLPPGDKIALQNWLTTLANYPKQPTPPPGPLPALSDVPPTKNPFMEPAIMAKLEEVMSELETVMSKIIRQSSLMQQAMIGLTTDMAEESYNFSVAGGQNAADLLKQDMYQHIALAVSSFVQAGAAVAVYGGISKQYDAVESQKTESMDAAEDMDTPQEKLDAKADARETAQAARSRIQSKEQMFQGLISQAGQVTQNVATAVTDATKQTLTVEQATNQAMSQMLDKLAQIVTQTSQSAQQSQDAATKAWQSFNQLYRDFSSTIARSMWG
jgi:hypothetical protein